MIKTISSLFLVIFMIATSYSQLKELPAFPGAEGNGKYVTGGRGGKVIYVTNLNDDNNPGSLRYAINQSGQRIIMFKVSGTIKLTSRLNISKSDVTIAGQTAPGDGITLRDYPVVVNTNNVIIRFLRFRMGDFTNQEADALGGTNKTRIIIDHCSMSWSTDECGSFYGNKEFTLQWSILSESLKNSVHGKGAHGYGGIWGGEGASFHHNLLSSHDSRNPRFCGSRYSNRPAAELVDFRNNVIFNWGSNSAYAGEGGRYNMINNYYKAGPATSKTSRIIEPYADDGSNSQPAGTYGHFYITGNFMTKSAAVSNYNWLGVNLNSTFATYAPGVTQDNIKSETEFPLEFVTTHSAEKAYEKIVEFCGASLERDSVDLRIIKDLVTGTVTFSNGGNGSKNGLIDTQSAVGGWPVLQSKDAPKDKDEDGMPDEWETANNLNPENSGDAQLKSVDGIYPNVEVYINSLVHEIVEAQNKDAVITGTRNLQVTNESINAYWNNSSKEIIINHALTVKRISVFSITGKLVEERNFNSTSFRMLLTNINPGIYTVKILDENNRQYSKKMINF